MQPVLINRSQLVPQCSSEEFDDLGSPFVCHAPPSRPSGPIRNPWYPAFGAGTVSLSFGMVVERRNFLALGSFERAPGSIADPIPLMNQTLPLDVPVGIAAANSGIPGCTAVDSITRWRTCSRRTAGYGYGAASPMMSVGLVASMPDSPQESVSRCQFGSKVFLTGSSLWRKGPGPPGTAPLQPAQIGG